MSNDLKTYNLSQFWTVIGFVFSRELKDSHNNGNLWVEEGHRVKLVMNFYSTSGREGVISMCCGKPESNLHSDSAH